MNNKNLVKVITAIDLQKDETKSRPGNIDPNPGSSFGSIIVLIIGVGIAALVVIFVGALAGPLQSPPPIITENPPPIPLGIVSIIIFFLILVVAKLSKKETNEEDE